MFFTGKGYYSVLKLFYSVNKVAVVLNFTQSKAMREVFYKLLLYSTLDE